MSGLAPRGRRSVARIVPDAKSTMETLPGLRLVTWRSRLPRLVWRLWASAPVLRKPVTSKVPRRARPDRRGVDQQQLAAEFAARDEGVSVAGEVGVAEPDARGSQRRAEQNRTADR